MKHMSCEKAHKQDSNNPNKEYEDELKEDEVETRMAQLINLPLTTNLSSFSSSSSSNLVNLSTFTYKLTCNGRFSCLFSNNRNKQDQARKALEGALGGNKEKLDKWNQEIKKREESGGGNGGRSGGGGGGWFGWGGRFGWSNGDNFWQETQQFSLAVLGILVLYLITAKGDVLLATIINPLLFALRSTRDSFTYMTFQITRRLFPASNQKFEDVQSLKPQRVSAKESVISKWGTD